MPMIYSARRKASPVFMLLLHSTQVHNWDLVCPGYRLFQIKNVLTDFDGNAGKSSVIGPPIGPI